MEIPKQQKTDRYSGSVLYVNGDQFRLAVNDRQSGVERIIEGNMPGDVQRAIDSMAVMADIDEPFNCFSYEEFGGHNAMAAINVQGQQKIHGQKYGQSEIEAKFGAMIAVINRYYVNRASDYTEMKTI